ncbi:MAG: hypothetical protein EOO89_24040, partial [Pedobacter sp.]
MKHILCITISLLLTTAVVAQTVNPPRILRSKRTTAAPKIDGILDDNIWIDAPLANNFIEFRPSPGKAETNAKRTEVKILYDNVAIYVFARMYDNPDSVAHEMVTRDQIGNADFIGVIFDTFKDGINGYGFYVTAAG